MSAVSPGLILIVALLGTAALVLLEWRRANRRHRLIRVAASIAAVAALCLLGIYRRGAEEKPGGLAREAVLWTHNANAAAQQTAGGELHFALPGITEKPAGAIDIPDVVYIQRQYPEIGRLRVVGDGLQPFQLAALAGIDLVFDQPAIAKREPTITFIHFPHELALGEKLRVQGRIGGLTSGVASTLTLVAPDRTKTDVTVAGDNSEHAIFEIVAPAPQSAGRFVWRLTARPAGEGEAFLSEDLGVAVVGPVLPRVLAIDGAARLETAHLERWYREIAGTIVSRTKVAQGRYRFASTDDAPAEFDALDRELLPRFDVLLVDAAALRALAPEEREAIQQAVAEDGLGMLTSADAQQTDAPHNEFLFPWQLEPTEELAVRGEARTARLNWRGLAAPLEQPVAIENTRLQLRPGHDALVVDAQDRPIVGAVTRGRGRIAVSIARDTWRWRLQDQSATFASYWSHVLTELSRRRDSTSPQWVIENGGRAPLSVNRPVSLRLLGPERAPVAAAITAEADQKTVTLALAEDPAEPHGWRTTFWPRHTGWHRVQIGPDGPHLDFFVHDANAWSSLGPTRRTRATQIAATQQTRRQDHTAATADRARTAAAAVASLYVLFLVSAAYLWVERRRAAA